MAERLDFVLRLIDKITSPAKRMTKSLGGVDRQMTAIGRNTGFRRLEKGAKSATTSVDRLKESGKGMIALSANLSLAAGAMQRMSTAAAGAFLAPIKEAATFEKSMSAVRARTSDFSNAQIEKARELGRTTKFTADQAAGAMEKLAMAGFNSQQQMTALAGVLNLDVATGNNNVSRTADIATNIMGGFGLKANEIGEASNVMVRVLNNSNLVLEELGETMSFAAPVAKKLGVSLKTTAVLAGALGDAGIKGSRGGTALRLMMVNLAGAAPPARKAMKKLGIETENAAGNLLPIEDILQNITEDFQNLGNAKQVQLATKIFGLRGASAGLIILDQLSTKAGGSIAKLNRAVADTSVTAKSVADVMEDNLLGDVTKVESAFSSLLIEIGNQFTPELRVLASTIKAMIPPMVEWVRENKSAVVIAGKGVAVFAALTGVLASIATAAASVALIWGGLQIAMAGLLPVWGFLSAAAFQLSGVFQVLWAGIQIGTAAALGALKGFVIGFTGGLAALGIGVVAAAAGWTLVFVTWWDEIKELVALMPSSFLELGANMADALINGWKSVFGRFDMVEEVDSVVQSIKSALGIASPSRVMMDVGTNMAKGMQMGMAGGAATGPATLAASGAAAMSGAGGGARTMVFRPVVNVSVGGGSASDGESVGESVATALRKVFDDGVAALGAG